MGHKDHDQLRNSIRQRVESVFAHLPDGIESKSQLPLVVLQNRERRANTRLIDALASRGTDVISDVIREKVAELSQAWAQRLFEDSFRSVEDFEIACAEQFALNNARQTGDPESIRLEERNEYLRRVEQQFGRQEMRGIQAPERVMLPLAEIYVPLHLRREPDFEAITRQENVSAESLQAFLDRISVVKALKSSPQLLIIGTPGSGKSTLVAWLASQLAKGMLQPQAALPSAAIPLVIPVRSLKTPELSVDVVSQFCGCPFDICEGAFESGSAIMLVDGMDEARPKFARQILAGIDRLRHRYQRLRIVMTSRPNELLKKEPALFLDFESTYLEELSDKEVEDFIHKWCLAAELSLEGVERLAREQANEAASDLIDRLQLSRSVRTLARTPLLCTVLCAVHRFLGHRIPEHRITLYEKCTEVLLYEWDAAKFRGRPEPNLGDLTARQKSDLLAPLAMRMHKGHRSEIARHEVVALFDELLPDLGAQISGDIIVKNIIERSGLLVEKADGVFAFSHLTFQEYLTAWYVAQSKSTQWLSTKIEDEWWHEVILLTAGMSGVNSESFIQSLLESKDSKGMGAMLAAASLETATLVSAGLRQRIQDSLPAIVSKLDNDDLQRLGMAAAPAIWATIPKKVRSASIPQKFFEIALVLRNILFLWDMEFPPVFPLCASYCREFDKLTEKDATRGEAMLIWWILKRFKESDSRFARAEAEQLKSELSFWDSEARLVSIIAFGSQIGSLGKR